MLKRIQKIQNIGKFNDCCVPGCEFNKEVVIHGFNTQGKSTLTAILRSLQTNNPNILIGRKTFGEGGDQIIEMDFENGSSRKAVFKDKKWNNADPNILIFDSKFIAENIFEGESINFDQQKNLNTIIIGSEGKKMNDEICELQKLSDELANKKAEKTKEFGRYFIGYDFSNFRKLIKDENIDEKIKKIDKEIKFEKEKSSIKIIVESHIESIGDINFSIKKILSKTLDSKHEDIEKHISAHFSKKENAQNFLKEGLDFLKDISPDVNSRSCVFCGQELGEKAENLISIYTKYFKDGYNDLQKEIIQTIEDFKNLNLAVLLTKLSADLKSKNLDIGLDESKIEVLQKYKKDFEKELYKKRDLNYPINFTTFDKLKDEIDNLKKALEELQKNKINITAKKSISELESEKSGLEAFKERFTPKWIELCDAVDEFDKQANYIRIKRESKRKVLEEYSQNMFSIHKESINTFCKEMGADFIIEDFKPLKKLIGKDERIFTIKFFDEHKININSDDPLPNFKNTLSESDKRLLAFAFFLSLLAHDKTLDKKIVVLDDPMSSFDRERRRKTIHLVADINCKYKNDDGEEKMIKPDQKIILTHDENFAKELKHEMPSACSVKIIECRESTNKYSKIAHTDFYLDFPDDDISDKIDKIRDILDSGSFTEPFEKDCRKVLENIFKHKYRLNLLEEIQSKKSIRTFTTKLAKEAINNFHQEAKFKKMIRLCDALNIELHDGQSHNSPGDNESILKDFFECLTIM